MGKTKMFKNEDDFKNFVRQLNIDTEPDDNHRNKLRWKMLSEFNESKLKQSPHVRSWRNTWRTIMQSKCTKLAAAAVIIIAALIVINQFGGSIDLAKPVYGISDVPRSIRRAKTIHIKSWFEPHTKGEVRGAPDLDDWIDIQNGRSRTSIFFWGMGPSGKGGRALIDVFDGQYKMEINPNIKRVKYEKLSEFQHRMYARKEIGRFLQRISLTSKTLNEYVKIGQEKINGVNCDIWERLISRSVAGKVFETKNLLWISADSGKLRKHQGWKKNKKTEGKWLLTWETEIYLDVICPEDIFKTVPPKGYSEKNSKETAPTPLLTGTRIYRANIEQGSIPITLALHDGTVIMSWQLNILAPGTDQAEIISNLEPGADLPKKLRDIMCTLVPEDKRDDTSYTARHLAYTQKDGRIYEWVIYIPNKKTQTQIARRYMAKSQWLVDGPDESSLRSVEALVIEEQEFSFWVHSAMGELSNDGVAPKHVTYENVVKLTEDIRASMKE